MPAPEANQSKRPTIIPSPVQGFTPYGVQKESPLEKLSLPTLEGSYERHERPIVYYHWAHIPERHAQLLSDIKERILEKKPERVFIYREGVGGTPSERKRMDAFETSLVSRSVWYARPMLWGLGVLARMLPENSNSKELKADVSYLKTLSSISRETRTPISLHTIDAHKFQIESNGVEQMKLLLKQFKKLVDQPASLSADYNLDAEGLRYYVEQGLTQTLLGSRHSITARDHVVHAQLQKHLEQASPQDLHIILTGAGHKSLARSIPAALQNRKVICYSEAVLELLPIELKGIALTEPLTYALARMEAHPNRVEARELSGYMLSEALLSPLEVHLEESSKTYRNLSERDQKELKTILATSLIHTMSDDELETLTAQLFENSMPAKDGETIIASLKRSCDDMWNKGCFKPYCESNPMVLKVLGQLKRQDAL